MHNFVCIYKTVCIRKLRPAYIFTFIPIIVREKIPKKLQHTNDEICGNDSAPSPSPSPLPVPIVSFPGRYFPPGPAWQYFSGQSHHATTMYSSSLWLR